MRCPSPACLLPELHCTERATVGEMFGEELAEQTLMCAAGRIVELIAACSGEKQLQRSARDGRKHASSGCETAAASAEGAASGMAEHHCVIVGQWRVTFAAHIHRRGESQFGDDAPRTRECGAERFLRCSDGKRVERIGDGVEERRIGIVAAEPQCELGDG